MHMERNIKKFFELHIKKYKERKARKRKDKFTVKIEKEGNRQQGK
jgi:hypothetical protein